MTKGNRKEEKVRTTNADRAYKNNNKLTKNV